MSQNQQPDNHGAFQAFHRWMRENFISTGLAGDGKFLPYDLISTHLESNGYAVLNSLLSAIYQGQAIPINAKEVVGAYSRVFCILIYIGKINFLQRFMECDDLNDAHLPFTERPRQFPIDSSLPELFTAFCNAQWIFCPSSLNTNCSRRLNEKEVLPLISRKLIGKGSSAEIFLIDIYGLYNSLNFLDDGSTSNNIFALKTYHGTDVEKSWENEVQAFKKVLQLRPTGSPNVIGFHTAFKHGDICHTILEYADRGSLEQYLRANTKPVVGEDIARLWKRVLGLVRGLKDLHNGNQVVWHQDIKPANILVLSDMNISTSPYASTFKIADLGTSHSKHFVSPDGDRSDGDTQGTRTYGAPECYLPDGPLGEGRIRVTATVDVFSLGCILSEIAVWMAGGMEDLLEYREARREATQRIPDFSGGDCFHDGTTMLPVVEEWHRKVIAKQTSTKDVFTPKLIPMIEQMLLPTQYREDSKTFAIKAHGTFSIALHEFRRRWPDADVPYDVLSNSQRMQHQRTEPSVRPTDVGDYETMDAVTPRATRFSSLGSNGHPTIPIINGFLNENLEDISASIHSIAPLQSKATSSMSNSEMPQDINEPEFNVPSGRSRHFSAPIDARAPIFENESIEVRRFSEQPPASRSILNEMSYQLRPLNNSEARVNRPLQPPMRPLQYPGLGVRTDLTGVGLSSIVYPPSASSYSPSPARPSTCLPLRFPDIIHTAEPSSTHGTNRAVVTMSRDEAMQWRDHSKSRASWSRGSVVLRDQWVLRHLDARDTVIIIDDSESMRKHWADMTELLSIITYMIKHYDKDGLDFYFASSRTKYHGDTSSKIVSFVDQKKQCKDNWGHTDMSSRLEQVLGEYALKVRRERLMGGTTRGLNVYVFTDANWTPQCNIVPAIDEIVRTLVEHRLPEKQVGLQFISFGDHPDCLGRLKLVDNYLVNPRLGLSLDIVDTTPSTGNLFKMIRGAIDRNYDYDGEVSSNSNANLRAHSNTNGYASSSSTPPKYEYG